MPRIPREVIEHNLRIYPTPRRYARSLGSSPWSGRTSSVKKSASCYTLFSSRRSTTPSDWPTRSSSQRPIPSRIIADNGTQFKSQLFQGYCEDNGIQLCFASVAHPWSNGQVERANAEILRGLKTRTYNCLKKHGVKWVEELPSMLLGNWTTPSLATGETPFFLVYGAKACLPPEIHLGSPRVQAFDESIQEKLWHSNVDLVDERWWRATIQNARYN